MNKDKERISMVLFGVHVKETSPSEAIKELKEISKGWSRYRKDETNVDGIISSLKKEV